MITPMLLYLAAASCWSLSSAQCLTANDISGNGTGGDTAVQTLTQGSTGFSLDLLRTLNSKADKDSSGLFFSPQSIWSALVVAYMGARGPTELEMRRVLGLGDLDKVAALRAFRSLQDRSNFEVNPWPDEMASARDSYRSANRIYFQQGTTFKECMRELLADEIAFVDFEQKAEEARQEINAWVEEQTQDRIRDLVPAGEVGSDTRMVIANAVYFKESWEQTFDPKKTAKRRFTLSNRKDIFVSMMSQRGRFSYGQSDELGCRALELPYAGGAISMVILLPRNRFSGVDSLANALTPARLDDLLLDLYPREMQVQIPKFRTEDSFELSPLLEKMGLRSLFDRRRVDLSGFTGQREFRLDAVYHKSFIDVDEEGTEAAAATVVISSRMAAAQPAAFIADYPFVFLIKENLSGAILFVGTVRKPTEFAAAD